MAIAEALEQAAVDRYAALGQCMRRVGHADIARIFEDLAEEEKRHVESVHRLADVWRPTEMASDIGQWVLPETFEMSEAGSAALLTPYKVLSIAVRGEEKAFSFWTYVASETDNDDLRAKAETMARQELVHAAKLRHERRRAFHAQQERWKPEEGTPLDPATIRSLLWRLEAEVAEALSIAADHLGQRVDAEIVQLLRRLAHELCATTIEPHPEAATGEYASKVRHAAAVGPVGILFEATGALEHLSERYLEMLGRSSDSALAVELGSRCERAMTGIDHLNAYLYGLDPNLKELARRTRSEHAEETTV